MSDTPEHDRDNVLHFKPRPPAPPENRKGPKPPPMLNIPPATKYLAGILLGIYAVITLAGLICGAVPSIATIAGGFIPASWSGAAPFMIWTPITPLTSILLHGSWMHVGINTLMLVAMGSGIEKWMGVKRYLLLFFGSGLIALLTHFAFEPFSDTPIVGASGGISGIFAAILMGMKGRDGNYSGILPMALAWIGISVLFGLMGSPDGSSVAWIAHIGGFIGGLGMTKLMIDRDAKKPPKSPPTYH